MPSAPPPPIAPHDDDDDSDASGSFVLRFGTAVGVGVVAAGLAAMPATLRIEGALSAQGPDTLHAWLACAAVELPAMLLAVLVLRGARIGLRAFGGPAASARAAAAALWVMLVFFVLATFGSMLRATTHHHALAGATFAIVGLGVAVVLGIFAARLASIIAAREERTRKILVAALSLVVAMLVALAGVRFARAFGGSPGAPSPVGALVVDLLAFATGAIFASHRAFAQRRPIAYVGPPAAAAIFALGLFTLRGSPALLDAIAERAPAIAALASVFAGH
jgi:hypothetical protein